MTLRYVLQSLRRRPQETFAAAIAVALTVAFLASLGSFVSQTGSKLSLRAAARGIRSFGAEVSEMYTGEGKAVLTALDGHLKGRNWIVGQAASIADIDAYGVFSYAAEAKLPVADYANVAAWMKRFEALPGFGKAETILPQESKAA